MSARKDKPFFVNINNCYTRLNKEQSNVLG